MLKGKSAIVTGSTSGIGEGIAKRFAANGCDVMLNGFGDADEIEALRSSMESEYGVKVGFKGADVSKYEDVEALVNYTTEQFGKVDILVNNAGIQFTAPIHEFPLEKWQAILNINLSGVFYGIRCVLPQMYARNSGRIINIASTHGLVASKEKAAYVAAKHAILGMTKVVALETATTGITANSICPGWVLTPLVQQQIEARAEKEGIEVKQAEEELLGEKQPSLQFTTPEQLGDLAVFLASDSAVNLTGQAIAMDGGWTAQ